MISYFIININYPLIFRVSKFKLVFLWKRCNNKVNNWIFYTRKILYQYLITVFWPQNNLGELNARTHRFKELYCTKNWCYSKVSKTSNIHTVTVSDLVWQIQSMHIHLRNFNLKWELIEFTEPNLSLKYMYLDVYF